MSTTGAMQAIPLQKDFTFVASFLSVEITKFVYRTGGFVLCTDFLTARIGSPSQIVQTRSNSFPLFSLGTMPWLCSDLSITFFAAQNFLWVLQGTD